MKALDTCIEFLSVNGENDLVVAAKAELARYRDADLMLRACLCGPWVCWRVPGIPKWAVGLPAGGQSHILDVDVTGLPLLTDEARAALKADR